MDGEAKTPKDEDSKENHKGSSKESEGRHHTTLRVHADCR